MIKKILIFCGLMALGNITFGQCPTAVFTLPGSACLNERLYPVNTSIGASSYNWDFCSGDFEVTPIAESIGSSNNIGRGRSFRIARAFSSDWIGFAIDQASNRLIRFEFGNNPQNIPNIMNLSNPDGILAGAYDFGIVQEAGQWYMLVINSTTNDLIRLSFGSSLLNNAPITNNLGNFSELNTPNNLKIVNELGNMFVFITNGGNNSITRLEFGNSILNSPSASSFIVTGINNPRGIDIIKDCDRWAGLVTSYSGNKVFYLDFNNTLNQTPTTGEISFFTSYNFPAALSIIHEGGQYYSLIQSALGDLYKLSFGTSIADFAGNGQNLGDFGLNNNFATEWISDQSNWYGFSIELDNVSTPGAGNLIRYTFPVTCDAFPSVSTLTKPKYEYLINGNHQVTLVAKNANNDINATNQTITVSSSVAPQIDAQLTGNCFSIPISFNGQQLSGNITNWNWDFGDGLGTSMLQNDTYTYASAGTYQVKLNVTDANGCNNLLIDTVLVYEEPIPDFTFPVGTLCMNNALAFANTTTGETGPAVTWTWDFNGEGSSVAKEPSFTFLTSGNKTVTLTSSIPGCANVTQKTIFIEQAPTTSFSFNNVCNTQTTTFNDQTIGSNLTAWNWDFGDGNFSTNQNPTHVYVAPGKYPVMLTVDNNLGCSTSISDTVYNHAAPVVNFTNDLPCSSSPIRFSDQSIVQDAGIVVWEWDFGDGNISTERNPQHTYGQTGNFTVQLKAYSQFGCVDSTESVITVIQGPEVDFNWDKACLDETTSFTDLTNSFGQPITSWTWLIDNTVFTQQNPQFTFSTSGTYTIQLSVTTNNLCAQTISKEIIVEATPLTSFDYSESCTSNTVTFYDTTPPSIAMRQWRIDGIMNSADSVMAESLLPGNYMISLATTTTSGCNSSLTKNINIVGSLVAQYTVSTDYGAAPLTVQFNNESTGADTYFWDFGDANNTPSTEIDPEFIFSDIGTYSVTLIANGGQNCADTTIQTIEVVDAVHGLSLDAITLLDGGSLALTLANMGSFSYNEDNLELVFTLDNGAEISETFATVLYPQKTINYLPNITLGDVKNSTILCAELQFIDSTPSAILDKNCLNLNSQAVIADAYPNPANDFINLSVVLPESGSVSFTLIDRTGAVIMHDTFESAQQGLNNYTIDTTPYRSGLYIIKIETPTGVREMKVVIDR